MGVTIAIDDFGTGYSSLGYLRRLPVQQIKIDRSFVKDMKANDSDRSIVCATIDLGHDLGLESVAEGVEDQHTLEVLRQSGCDQIQGYYLSRPLPAAECTDWLTEYVTRNQQESASFDGNTPASDTMPEPDAHSASGTPHS